MRVAFLISIDVDPAVIEREGKRIGLTIERACESFLADVECRLVDAIRFRDGVTRIGSNLQTPPTPELPQPSRDDAAIH